MKSRHYLVLLSFFALLSHEGCGPVQPTSSGNGLQANLALRLDSLEFGATTTRTWVDLELYGTITGHVVPAITGIFLNGERIDEYLEWRINGGELVLYTPAESIPFDGSQFELIVETDIGSLTGQISLPDSVSDVNVSAWKNVNPLTPWHASWACESADYYYLMAVFAYEDSLGYRGTYNVDTIIEAREFMVDSLPIISDSCWLEYVRIFPANGPSQTVGSKPNMYGDGVGYLFAGRNGSLYWREFAYPTIKVSVQTRANSSTVPIGSARDR